MSNKWKHIHNEFWTCEHPSDAENPTKFKLEDILKRNGVCLERRNRSLEGERINTLSSSGRARKSKDQRCIIVSSMKDVLRIASDPYDAEP